MPDPIVTAFFDQETFTVSYVVQDPNSKHCAIIDSVLDIDMASGRTSTQSADQIIDFVKSNQLIVDWILETHVHADHLTASVYLKEKLGGKTAIGENIKAVQATFKKIYNAQDVVPDGSQFDHLFKDGETFRIGGLEARVMHTPGHTPACLTYVIGDAAFVGDTLFMPDYGTARADFPGGNARILYRSIQKILSLPSETRLFMCHDYAPGGRDYQWETTVAEEKAHNKHVGGGVSEADYVKMRTERDATLGMPRLLLPSIQVNMRAGHFPPEEDNGVSYLKLPVNAV